MTWNKIHYCENQYSLWRRTWYFRGMGYLFVSFILRMCKILIFIILEWMKEKHTLYSGSSAPESAFWRLEGVGSSRVKILQEYYYGHYCEKREKLFFN